jgi:hypothetical protein
MCRDRARIACVFRVKRFLEMQEVPAPQSHHIAINAISAIWQKSICYTHLTRGQSCSRGLFEKVEMTMNEREAKARDIKADYDGCRKTYEDCLTELEAMGFTEARADDILIPVTRINGTYPK